MSKQKYRISQYYHVLLAEVIDFFDVVGIDSENALRSTKRILTPQQYGQTPDGPPQVANIVRKLAFFLRIL